MNVVYVSSIESGGPVTHLLDLAPRVSALGVDVRVVCPSHLLANRFRRSGVAARVQPIRHQADLAAAGSIWKYLTGADIVHTQDRRAGLLVRPVARLCGARSVHTVHGITEEIALQVRPVGSSASREGGSYSLGARLRLHAEALLSRLGTTVTPSVALAEFLATHGFHRDRIVVVPNGIDVTRCETASRHDPFTLAAVGLLEPHKALDVLLEACAQLNFPYRLDVFGDGSLRASLEGQARELEVVAQFHGFVPDVRRSIEEADLLVHPSQAENLPLAVLEAMACAVPVVACRVGGVPELVVDGVTGLLVDPGQPAALAGAISRICEDEGLRRSLGTAGARRAQTDFSADDTARRMVALYEQL